MMSGSMQKIEEKSAKETAAILLAIEESLMKQACSSVIAKKFSFSVFFVRFFMGQNRRLS